MHPAGPGIHLGRRQRSSCATDSPRSTRRGTARAGKRRARRSEPAPRQLEAGDVGRLQAFRTLRDFKLYRLAFIQRLVTICLNGGEVYENVLAALPLDESVALAGVKPLYCSLFFHKYSLLIELFGVFLPRAVNSKKGLQMRPAAPPNDSKDDPEQQTQKQYTTTALLTQRSLLRGPWEPPGGTTPRFFVRL